MGVHDGHRDRKREQFLRCGAESFADHELLELLLYYAIPQKDTNPIAHALMERVLAVTPTFHSSMFTSRIKPAILWRMVPK